MKLVRAEFENFRLLRHLELDFSTDGAKPLTVIRAENESGKTTILNALQWALYGDEALPEQGRGFRLHPIDWDSSSGTQISIVVTVDFESVARQKGPVTTVRRYRIVRTTQETLSGTEWQRLPSTVRLFEITNAGFEPIDPPDARIQEELPSDLREVFFTDGDRALSFIEAAVSTTTKRRRVENAIRSLLQLDLIEKARRHVKKTAADVNRAARGIGTDEKYQQVMTRLAKIDEEAEELEEKMHDAETQFQTFDGELADVQQKIDAALVLGNREQLKTQIAQVEHHLTNIDNQRRMATREHAQLFRSLSLSRDLLGTVLERGLDKLNELRDRGKIPNTTIPVLEERLRGTICICGETLDSNDAAGVERRTHIQHLIDESERSDELQTIVSDLYYGSRLLEPKRVGTDEHWLADYARVVQRRDELDRMRADQVEEKKTLEARLGRIPDSDLQGWLATKKHYMEQRDRFYGAHITYKTRLEQLRDTEKSLARQRDNLLKEQKKGAAVLADLYVVQDVEHVLASSIERITREELSKVSELTNLLFLGMIGADPEQGAIIQKVEISSSFDITVLGPNGRTLNPDLDLNGASRRALTLAFILALTKVSGVVAPNIIDTPLGAMSGFVKRSVLRTAIRESSQLVLFLTRSEIAGCEEILDAGAGRVVTLTNPRHYPSMLVNDPQVAQRTVMRCECNHRQECKKCRRRLDPHEEANGIN